MQDAYLAQQPVTYGQPMVQPVGAYPVPGAYVQQPAVVYAQQPGVIYAQPQTVIIDNRRTDETNALIILIAGFFCFCVWFAGFAFIKSPESSARRYGWASVCLAFISTIAIAIGIITWAMAVKSVADQISAYTLSPDYWSAYTPSPYYWSP